jgi:hypothetical protein
MKKWSELNPQRKTLTIVVLIFIVFMFIITYINREEWLSQKMKTTYPDGCVEIVKGTLHGQIMITPECTRGRMIQKSRQESLVLNYGMFNGTTTR